jgi:hypothetical protein
VKLCISDFNRIKPLPFRGGVGVGLVHYAPCKSDSPTPLRLGSKLPSLTAPPLKGRGKSTSILPNQARVHRLRQHECRDPGYPNHHRDINVEHPFHPCTFQPQRDHLDRASEHRVTDGIG